jgi:autotransporter-associated beta strand protein
MKTIFSSSFTSPALPLHAIGVDRFRLLLNGWGLKVLSLLLLVVFGVNGVRAQSYTSTSAATAWSASRWNSTDAAPYTSVYTANNAVSFTSGTYTFAGMGATTNVGNVTVASGVTVNFASIGSTFATNGAVRTFDIGSGGLFDFNSQTISAAAGTGFIKTGAGVFATGSCGFLTGGFTLNNGTVIIRGTTGLGNGTGSFLTLNGGTVASNATRSIDNTRFPVGITIGGNVQFGEMSTVVSLAHSTADLSFANNISLGSSLRTLTLGNGGITTFSGVISGSGGLIFAANANGTGKFVLTGVNTYTGNTTISSGKLALSGSGSIATSPIITVGSAATFDISGRSAALTLAAGQSLRSSASGSNTTATVIVGTTPTLTLSAGGLGFTAYGGGATAPITVAGTGGSLALASSPVTVTTTTALGVGTYKLIAKSGSATVTGTPGTLTMAGSGLATNTSGALSVSSGELILTVSSSASSSSNIILNSGFTHPTNIDYTAYQAVSGLTTGNSIEVGQFDIQDGGGSADADAIGTTLTAISLTVANYGNIRSLALFEGITNVAEISSVTSTSSFSSLTLEALDDASKTFSIRATFKNTVTDNQQISFTVSSATASSSGSSFAAANAGAAATTTAGDNNRIEVSTSAVIFDQNVSSVSQNAVMNPSPTVLAVDNNANFDLDNTSNVVMTISTGLATFGSATTTVAMVSGIATFTNLVFATAANNNQLTATQGAFTDVSANFNVSASSPEINVKQGITSLFSGSGTYAAGNIVSGNSGSPVTFTIENIGGANLTYSSINNSNNSDFTLDLTNTSSPISASGTTTFTLSFNPSTAGAKSTTITINNNDLDDGTYTFTVTGTGVVSTASDIICNSGYSYSSNINYASYQSVSILTTGNSVGVNGLTIRDGGATTDADNLATTLTAITFSTGGSTAIRTAALFDGSTNIAEVAVNGGTSIAFSGLTLSTGTDGGTKNFELRVTYQASVTDNQQITFTVSSASASATNSGFATANAGAAASTATSDINRLEVTASALAFVTQPANTLVGAGMSNVTVSANDGNGNRDLDFTNSVRITSTGTLTGTPVDVSASSGLATFTSLTHTAPGSSLTLNAERTSGLDWDVTSSTFNITVQEPGLLLLEDNFTATGGALTSNSWIQIATTSINPITTGNGNGLSYTNYASSNIGNASIMTTSGQDVYRTFTSQNPGQGTSTAYFSSLVSLSAAQVNGDYFLTLGESSTFSTSAVYRARIYAKQGSTASKILFGIATTNGTVTYTTTEYNINTTILLAVKHVFTTSTSTSSLFINPSTSSEPTSADISDATASTVTTGLNAVVFRQGTAGNAATLVIDGVRVATNWGALMGNPQYNSSTNIGAGNYNNINLISGTVTATGNVTVSGTLSLNAGTLDIGSSTFVINGPVSQTSGTIDADAGTVSFTNANDLNLPTSLFSGNIYNLSKVSGAGTVTLNDNLTVTNELNSTASTGAFIIASSKELAVSGTGKATIDGVITNNGTFTLNSGATLVQGSGGSITGGAYNVKQNITGAGSGTPTGRYWYVGSPVSGATSAVYNASGENILKYYSEPANAWQEITDNTSSIEVGRGYFVQAASGTSELNFTGGTINNGDYTLNVTRNTTTNAYRGYNLLTNPYPSYLDWDNVSRNQVGTTIWYRTWNSNSNTMVFDTYNDPAGFGTNNNQAGAVSNWIPPMQSFWVSVPQGQTSGTVSFGNAQRSHFIDLATNGYNGLRSSAQDFPAFLRLNLLDGNFVDQTILYMKPDANNTFDEYDSEKMFLGGVPQFYSTVNAKKLVLNGMKNQKARTSVPLTMELPTSKSYTFQAEEFNIEDGLILLEDKQEGIIQDLTINPTYSFFGNAGTNATRFVVHFQLANAPILVGGPMELESLGSDELTSENIQIVSNNQGTIIIRMDEGFKPEGSIRIFDASGRLVEQTDFNDQETTIQLNEQAGMYFVEVSAGKLMVKKKIVIE